MTEQVWSSQVNHPLAGNSSICTNKSQVDSISPCHYYEGSGEENTLTSFVESTPPAKVKEGATKQSRQLPHWAWFIIAKCLGIPLHEHDKLIVGLVFHILTFASALTFAISHVWIVVFDILSPNTPLDIPNGTVSIFIIICWGMFGFYAKNLSGRLFRHPQFLKDIRMHSRTIFKINATFLFFLLGAVFISANDYDAYDSFLNEKCEKINLHAIVCKLQFISRVIFSILSLIWNSLISFVMISVCRTHTIGIRRFIRELECDAVLHEHYLIGTNVDGPLKYEDICQETSWLDDDASNTDDEVLSNDESLSVYQNYPHLRKSSRRNTCPPAISTPQSSYQELKNVNELEVVDEIGILVAPLKSNGTQSSNIQEDTNKNNKRQGRSFIPVKEMAKGASVVESSEDGLVTAHTMSTAEILHHYWKIFCRLRLSSAALQRWFISLTLLVILWCFVYLVYWLRNPATATDILQFVVPLIIIVLLSSALAEVNMEGQRMVRCICPTEERLRLLQFLTQNPLIMPVYGFAMTHGTIITVIFAILVGFTTRIIITEMTK